ncbi:hypothetical protein [Parvularcula lutaonensis]|uniref:Lipoprotein n=1 Tax=Parvularcula lutaonensis TaxID=491923 RepID=A0ABV7MBU1_9PROT|nr:hypothetical protein [Parvularcula lutaonensis]GGY49288.1 hypothetical protein GCM10007148_17240 [Parvularcula lutaonensis]
MKHLPIAFGALALAACGGTPVLDDPSTLPPVEETKDWEDWGKEENIARRVEGVPLSGNAITARLVGTELTGCYPSGESFAERLTENGDVVEPGTGRLLAKYKVQNDYLCFQYPNQQPACYTVTDKGGTLYFYTAGGYRLVAASTCPIPPGTRGLD